MIRAPAEQNTGRTLVLPVFLSQPMDAPGEGLRRAKRRVADVKHALVRLTASMDALSPRKVLSRGSAIASGSGGTVLRRAADAEIGEKINVRLGEGSLGCRVEERKENDGDG